MILRFITGISLIILCVSAYVIDGLFLFFTLLFATTLCVFELYLMLKEKGYSPNIYVIVAGTLVLFSTIFLKDSLAIYRSIPVAILILGLLIFYIVELINKKPLFPKNSFLLSLRVIIFFTIPFVLLFLTRSLDGGLFKLIYVSTLVWASDSFALFGGKLWGKHPLTRISPKKTIEGSLVALAASGILGLICAYLFNLGFIWCVLVALIVSVIAQLGDLHESLVKRYLNIKDSSHILPGHGGVYDRLDSCLFVIPIMFYFL